MNRKQAAEIGAFVLPIIGIIIGCVLATLGGSALPTGLMAVLVFALWEGCLIGVWGFEAGGKLEIIDSDGTIARVIESPLTQEQLTISTLADEVFRSILPLKPLSSLPKPVEQLLLNAYCVADNAGEATCPRCKKIAALIEQFLKHEATIPLDGDENKP